MEQNRLQKQVMYIHLTFLPLIGFILSTFLSKQISQNEPAFEQHRKYAKDFSLVMIGQIVIFYLISVALVILLGIVFGKGQFLNQILHGLLFTAIGTLIIIYFLWTAFVIRAALRAKNGLTPLYPKMPFQKNRF